MATRAKLSFRRAISNSPPPQEGTSLTQIASSRLQDISPDRLTHASNRKVTKRIPKFGLAAPERLAAGARIRRDVRYGAMSDTARCPIRHGARYGTVPNTALRADDRVDERLGLERSKIVGAPAET